LAAIYGFIIAMIPKESVMIRCSGALFGIGIDEIVCKRVYAAFPTLRVAMRFDDLIRGCAGGSQREQQTQKILRAGLPGCLAQGL
jgi:hypothetical protein